MSDREDTQADAWTRFSEAGPYETFTLTGLTEDGQVSVVGFPDVPSSIAMLDLAKERLLLSNAETTEFDIVQADKETVH